MKTLLLIFHLLIILTINCYSQNLVPNPSFEDTLSCPEGLNEVYRANNWSSFGNTPDYWNACSPVMNVPYTSGGFQNAFQGNAFCGVYTYYSGTTGAPNYREYIGSQLNSQLNIGEKYFVSFNINKPNNTECATNNFGLLLSTVSYSESTLTPYSNTPQIIASQVISDTLNWITISGAFISDSAYNFIILGGFNNDSNTDTILYNGQSDCIAYYFIDMVCVSTDSLTCNPLISTDKIYSSTNNINIFPNPSKDKFNIILPQNIKEDKANIKVYNMFSELIYEDKTPLQTNTINLSNCSEGIYLVFIQIGNKHFVRKLLLTN